MPIGIPHRSTRPVMTCKRFTEKNECEIQKLRLFTRIFGNVNISRNLRVRDEDDARDVSLGSNLQLPKIWL